MALRIETGICKDFLRGECEFGDSCKYSHTMELTYQVARMTLHCKDYTLGGNCRLGKTCLKKHEVRSSYLRAIDILRKKGQNPCYNFFVDETCWYNGYGCRFEHKYTWKDVMGLVVKNLKT